MDRRSTPTHDRGVTDYRTRLDYGNRADNQPVYIGRAPMGTAPEAGTWTIERVTYDGEDRATDKQVLVGAWTQRAALPWL